MANTVRKTYVEHTLSLIEYMHFHTCCTF